MTSEGGVPFGAQHFPQSSSVVPGISTNMFQTSSYFNLSPESPNKNPFSFVSATAPSQQHSSLPASNPIGPSGASLSSGYPQQGQVPPWSYPSGTASEPSSLQLVKEERASAGEYSDQPPPMSFGEHTSTLQEQMKVPFSDFNQVGMAHNPSNAFPNSQPFHQQHSRENTFGFPSPPHPMTDMDPHLGHRQSMPAIPVASRLFSGSREQGSAFFSSIPPQSLPAPLEPRSVSQPLGSSSAPSTGLLKSLSPVRGDTRHSYHPSPELQSGDAARGSDDFLSGKPMQLEEVMHLGAQLPEPYPPEPYPPEQPYLSTLMNHEIPYSSRELYDSPSRLSRPPSNAEINIANNQQLDRPYPTNVTNADLSQPIRVQSGKPQTNVNYPSPHDTPVPTSPKRSDENPSLIPQQDQRHPQPWGEGPFPIGDHGRLPHLEQALAKSMGGFGKPLELGVVADLVNLSNGESVEVPSLSSSLNHSVSSLLDSQEDFTQISPCKILPPTPENVLYRAVTPPSGFPLRETTIPSEHQPLAVSASTENQDLTTFVHHQPPEEDKRYSSFHVPVPFVSHVMTAQVAHPLPQLAPSGTTQVAHPLPQLAPSGTTQVAHPLPQLLAPSGTTQVAHPLPQLAPSGTTQVTHPLPQLAPSGITQVAHPPPHLAPSGTTQVTHPYPQLAPSGTTQVAHPPPQLAPSGTTQVAHPLPQLAPSGTTQVAHPLPQLLAPSGTTQVAHPPPQLAPSGTTQVGHPLPQLAPSGTTQVAHPLPQLAPSGTTQVAHPRSQLAPCGTTQYSGEPSQVLPTGFPQSDTSRLLDMDPSPPTRPNIHSQLPTQPSQPPTATAPPLQEVPLPSTLDTVLQTSMGNTVSQPSAVLNPTGFPPQSQSQLAAVQATHQSAIDSNIPSHPHQPNVGPVPLTANYQLPTEHHMSTTVQPTPVVYATLPSTVPTGTGNITEGVPTPHPPASIAPVSQSHQLQPSGVSQSAHMPRITPDVAPSTETMPSQASPQFGSLLHPQPSVGSVPPSITSQAIPTSSPQQGTLPTNPPPIGTTTSAQAVVHPDSDIQIQPTVPGTSFPPQREGIPPSSGSEAIRSHFQSPPTANQQELQPSHAVYLQSQSSSLQEPTPTSQPDVTQEGSRYAYPPNSDHPNARGRYEGQPDERGRYEHHPDGRGRYEERPDERGRYEHHPDGRGRYEERPDERGRYEHHPDGRGRYEERPDERGRYEHHPDGRGRYEERPDERGRYEHHPDGRGRYMYEDPRSYYQTDDPYNRDDHYRSERSRHPSYRDQDPYSHRPGQEYHHRPHSRQPYDYYSDYRHEYGQERRQYDYGRYAYEEDYYGYHRANPYHERDGSHHYDERYYDPRYDSQYGGYDYDQRDPEGQQTYYHEYPEGSSGYDVQYHAQDGHYSTTHDYNQQSTTDPEASVIYGKPTDQHFEISQMFDSPNTRLPNHSEHLRHESTAYPEQLSYYGGDYTDDAHYQQQLYYEEGYGTEEPVWAPVQATPPPPPRETPELFVQPHVRACFGIGGQLVTILPNNPRAREAATVEICSLKDVLSDPSMCEFVEAVGVSPGPFVPGDTPKSEVVRFASTEAEKCRQKSQVEENEPMAQSLEDEALLWDFLVLLCQQNGVVVPSDVAELLMRDRTVAVNSSTHIGGSGSREESLDAFRQLLLAGRKKDALDLACARSLWGHALMLASGMDEQSRTYVVNRFTASLMVTDPLNTFYTLLLGRTPSAVKSEGLSRAGDWRSHLAMVLSNRSSKLDNSCIVTLGDSLLSQGRLNAAHLCYHLGQVQFGLYGEMDDSKYTLLGVEHSHLKIGAYPTPPELHKMEVFEYAMSLGKKDFSLPHFQMFKLLHVLKLVEAGFSVKGLKYCEQISYSASNAPRAFTPTFLLLLMELSANLHHVTCPLGVMENELPSWLLSLQQSVREALSADYTPSMRSSPSPAFSSVSQTYGNQQLSQPVIGLGQYLTIPSSLRGSSAASSKEGSVADLQVAVPRVDSGGHQLEIQTTHAAEKDASELVIPAGESGGIAPQQSEDTFVSQYQGNVDMQQYLPQTQNMEGTQQASYPYQQPFLQQQDINQAQASEPGTETAIDSQPTYGSYMGYGMTSGAESGVTQGDSSANVNTQMTYYGMQPSSGGFAMEGQPEVSSDYQVATNEQRDWNQEGAEPETPVAKQPMSGDDHVTNEKLEEEPEDETPPEKKGMFLCCR